MATPNTVTGSERWGEQAMQAPEAGSGTVLVQGFHGHVALPLDRARSHHFRQEGLRCRIAVQHAVLATFLVVDDELHRDPRTVRPGDSWRVVGVSDQLTRILGAVQGIFGSCRCQGVQAKLCDTVDLGEGTIEFGGRIVLQPFLEACEDSMAVAAPYGHDERHVELRLVRLVQALESVKLLGGTLVEPGAGLFVGRVLGEFALHGSLAGKVRMGIDQLQLLGDGCLGQCCRHGGGQGCHIALFRVEAGLPGSSRDP